jgi:hypothetical protein
MHKPTDARSSFGPRNYWYEAIDDPGASQMRHLKNLILSRPYFEREPAQELLAAPQGNKYDYIAVMRTRGSVMAYSYTGRPIELKLGVLKGRDVVTWWYNPRDGTAQKIGTFPNKRTRTFTPPAARQDCVLVVDSAEEKFGLPGQL